MPTTLRQLGKRCQEESSGAVSAALEGFELFEGAGPVGAEQAGEAAVGQDVAAGLAAGAVVGLVVGVANALDGIAAARAGLAELTVNGKLGAEGGYFFGEFISGFGLQPAYPLSQRGARGGEEALPFFGLELVGLGDGRELGRVQNLVGVGVAYAADEARIGEGALERAVLERECGAEFVQIRGKDFDAAGIDFMESLFAAQ